MEIASSCSTDAMPSFFRNESEFSCDWGSKERCTRCAGTMCWEGNLEEAEELPCEKGTSGCKEGGQGGGGAVFIVMNDD